MKTSAQSPAVSNANIPTTRCNIGHNITHNGWMESCFHLWNYCRQSIMQKNIAEVKSCSTQALGLNQVTNLIPRAFCLACPQTREKAILRIRKSDEKCYANCRMKRRTANKQSRPWFDHISKQREESWKYDAWRSNFEKLWIFLEYNQTVGQTLSRVFDTSTQWKLKLW